MTNKNFWLSLMLTLGLAATTLGQTQATDALEGLDPVMLVQGKEAQGDLKITVKSPVFLLIEVTVKTRPVDILIAMNFSYFFFKERAKLRNYFKRARAALADDGVMFLDCFGGYDCFRELKEHTEYDDFTYTWEHAKYDPVTGDMTCYIHFSFPDGSKMPRAFTYEWRMWTLPEIREILAEAGFSRTTVYWQGWDEEEETGSGEFTAVETAEADAGWICYIAAEK